MSKSLNNFLTLRDVLDQYSGEEIRTFIVGSHYRSPLNYMTESLDAARESLKRFYIALRGRTLNELEDGVAANNKNVDVAFIDRFDLAMNDDLNTPEAMSVLHDLAGTLNRENDAASDRSRLLATTLKYLGGRLGILEQDPEVALQGGDTSDGPDAAAIEALITERNDARAARNFARSDEIRDELAALGVILEDAGGKTTWRRQ